MYLFRVRVLWSMDMFYMYKWVLLISIHLIISMVLFMLILMCTKIF